MKAKILVVEDEGLVALDLTERLRRFGYEVPAPAGSAEEALARERDTMPDLILMDITIQGPLDGVDVAQVMRSRRDVPVVFLTAHSDAATLERAKTAGPYGYVLKPFRDRELQIVIDMALNKHRIEINLAKLQQGVVVTRKLSGLLPICASCKKIRNDKEEWEAVEAYIQTHSDAEFTHGICPDCSKKLYPEHFSRVGKAAKASGGKP